MVKRTDNIEFDCNNHTALHDNVQPKTKYKEEVTVYPPYSPVEDLTGNARKNNDDQFELSPDQVRLWEENIKDTVLTSVINHIASGKWNAAIKGLKFIRDTESLIHRPTGESTR